MSALCFRVCSKIRYLVLIVMPYIEAPSSEIFRLLSYCNDARSPSDLHVFCCFLFRQAFDSWELSAFTYFEFLSEFYQIIAENVDPFLYSQRYYATTNHNSLWKIFSSFTKDMISFLKKVGKCLFSTVTSTKLLPSLKNYVWINRYGICNTWHPILIQTL
jgi:hypothetical protein